jgi:CheY-like chemotaxis protein
VDDDSNIRQLFSRILSRGGYAVHSVESGTDALQALATEAPFDLMVLDLCMPKPDGFEILKEARLQYPGLRILVVSGFYEGALLPASTFLGATATLNKTEAPQTLLSVANELLQCS